MRRQADFIDLTGIWGYDAFVPKILKLLVFSFFIKVDF